MTSATAAPGGTYQLGDLTVSRVGFGAMQLAGPGVFGPPADRTRRSRCCARRWRWA